MTKEEKAIQKALKEEFLAELSRNGKMGAGSIEYAIQDSAYMVKLADGSIITFSKPRIQKDFCYGYGQNGISSDDDYDMARQMADHAMFDSLHFINENLKPLRTALTNLALYPHMAYTSRYSWLLDDGSNARTLNFFMNSSDKRWMLESKAELRLLTEDDVNRLIAAYNVIIAEFKKRLNTYLKRYGLKNVNAWTYLVD